MTANYFNNTFNSFNNFGQQQQHQHISAMPQFPHSMQHPLAGQEGAMSQRAPLPALGGNAAAPLVGRLPAQAAQNMAAPLNTAFCQRQQQQQQLSGVPQYPHSMQRPLAGQNASMPQRAAVPALGGNAAAPVAGPHPPAQPTQLSGPHLLSLLANLHTTFHLTTTSLTLTHNPDSTLQVSIQGLLRSNHHLSSPPVLHLTQHNLSRLGQATFHAFNAPVACGMISAFAAVLEDPGQTTVFGGRMVLTALESLWINPQSTQGLLYSREDGMGMLRIVGAEPRFDPVALEAAIYVSRPVVERAFWERHGRDVGGNLVMMGFEREFCAVQQQQQNMRGVPAAAMAPSVPARTLPTGIMPAVQNGYALQSAAMGGQGRRQDTSEISSLQPTASPAREEQTIPCSRTASPFPTEDSTAAPLPAVEEDDTTMDASLEADLFGDNDESDLLPAPTSPPRPTFALPPKRKASTANLHHTEQRAPKRPALALPPFALPVVAAPPPTPTATPQTPQKKKRAFMKENALSLPLVQHHCKTSSTYLPNPKWTKTQLQDFLKRGPKGWREGIWLKEFKKGELEERFVELAKFGEFEGWVEGGEGEEFVRREGWEVEREFVSGMVVGKREGERWKRGEGKWKRRRDSGYGGSGLSPLTPPAVVPLFSAGSRLQNPLAGTPALSSRPTSSGSTSQNPVDVDNPSASSVLALQAPPASSSLPTPSGSTSQDPLDVDAAPAAAAAPPCAQPQQEKKKKKNFVIYNRDYYDKYPELRPKGSLQQQQEFSDVPVVGRYNPARDGPLHLSDDDEDEGLIGAGAAISTEKQTKVPRKRKRKTRKSVPDLVSEESAADIQPGSPPAASTLSKKKRAPRRKKNVIAPEHASPVLEAPPPTPPKEQQGIDPILQKSLEELEQQLQDPVVDQQEEEEEEEEEGLAELVLENGEENLNPPRAESPSRETPVAVEEGKEDDDLDSLFGDDDSLFGDDEMGDAEEEEEEGYRPLSPSLRIFSPAVAEKEAAVVAEVDDKEGDDALEAALWAEFEAGFEEDEEVESEEESEEE